MCNDSSIYFPLVTIGITCFNAEDTVGRAIQSARQQTWPNLEIVIVDDGSTDNSCMIIQREILIDSRIRLVLHKKNMGFPAALNTIIRNSTGEYIAFFDDDDESVPERVTKQVVRIQEYNRKWDTEFVLCYSNRKVVMPGEPNFHSGMAIGRCAPEPHGQMVADYLLGIRMDPSRVWGIFGSLTMMVVRSVFLKIGCFDESFRRCAEWDIAIRAAFLGAHFIAVDEPLVIQYKTFTSDKSRKKTLKYALLLRKKHRNYLKSQNAYLSSIMYAYGNYFNSKNMRLLCFLCKIISSVCYPQKIIYRIQNRLK